MGLNHSPKIVTSGLVLCLDAENRKSYLSGSSTVADGTTWNDLSGQNNTFLAYVEAGGTMGYTQNQGFGGFSIASPSVLFIENNSVSNFKNFKTSQGGNGYTIVVWAKVISSGAGFIFSNDGGTYMNFQTDTAGYLSTTDGSTLYYNSGIVAGPTFFTADSVWRMYVATNLNSGQLTNPTAEMILGVHGSATGSLRMSMLSVYNRVLTIQEMTQNFNALRGRYGV